MIDLIKSLCKSIIQAYILIFTNIYNIAKDLDIKSIFNTYIQGIILFFNDFTMDILINYYKNNITEMKNIIYCCIQEENQLHLIQTCFNKYEYIALSLPWISHICLILSICILLYNTHNINEMLHYHRKVHSNSNSNEEIHSKMKNNKRSTPEKVSTPIPKTQLGRALNIQSTFNTNTNALPKADIVNTTISTPMTNNTVQSTAYSAITLSPRLLSPLESLSPNSSSNSNKEMYTYPVNENNPSYSKNAKYIKNSIGFGEKAGIGDDLYSVMSQNDKYLNPHSHSHVYTGHNKEKKIASADLSSYVLSQAVEFPSILIGWRIDVPGIGCGLVLGIQKKKFRSTNFQVQFDDENGKTKTMLLPLQRSEKKGTVPFTLLNKTS